MVLLEMRNRMNNNDKKPESNQGSVFNFLIIALLATFIFNLAMQSLVSSSHNQIEYNKFLQMLDNNEIEAVGIIEDRLVITTKKPSEDKSEDSSSESPAKDTQIVGESPSYYTGNVNDPQLIQRLIDNGVRFYKPIQNNNPIINFITTWVLPIVIMYAILSLFLGFMAKKMGMGGGFMGMGRSNAKVYIEKKTGITFEDVAGQEEAKESLREIVDFLHHPDKYIAIGAKQPKGALLVGPPGTGKTLLAKAVAGEAKVAFFSLSGSEFVEMFVGVGASRVRDLFKQADQHAPCIIFIDEIDAIGKSRDSQFGGGNDEREQTLNQLLAEMDGFDSSKGVVILAATNRPEILDKALLRPGRFDRRVIVERPDLKGREAILKVHSKKVKMSNDVDLNAIALATSGAVGADLANMVNEAALRAVRLERKEVIQEDLYDAVEVIIAGKEKKDRIMTDKEKRIVAFHEIGHALVTALQKNSQPVQKITIVPRTMGALGYTMSVPEEEKFLMSKDDILVEITSLLAGRAAEKLACNTETTGASNDIERATKLARSMITQYGMSEKFGMVMLDHVESKYLDQRAGSVCSQITEAEVDKEVREVIRSCYDNAVSILENHTDDLNKLSDFLFEKETITGKEFMDMIGLSTGTDKEIDKEK